MIRPAFLLEVLLLDDLLCAFATVCEISSLKPAIPRTAGQVAKNSRVESGHYTFRWALDIGLRPC